MEDKQNNNSTLQKKVQKALDKLISDEWFAGSVYKQFYLLADNEGRRIAGEAFLDTANDEMLDHLNGLVKFAMQNGFTAPTTYSEMKKHADKEDIKLFENGKRGEDVTWYVKKAIEAEQRALEEYEKYVDDSDFNAFPELQLVVRNNYYDEIEHLKEFEFIASSIEASRKFN